MAIWLVRGASSLSNSSHLPGIVDSILVNPVTLPPGRGKLATKPLRTGSVTTANTIGMVRVCRSRAAVVGVLCERMRSGCSATSSSACRGNDVPSDGVQRMSMRTLWPSIHPSFPNSSRNDATNAWRSRSFSVRSEEHTSELQSRPQLVCRLLLEKKKENGNGQAVAHGRNGKKVPIAARAREDERGLAFVAQLHEMVDALAPDPPVFVVLQLRGPQRSTLFPYTTLFR